jgi:hypothetical protein
MMAFPKVFGGELEIHPAGEGAFIVCEIGTPPSMRGRTVDVFLDAEAVAALRRYFCETPEEILDGEVVEDDNVLMPVDPYQHCTNCGGMHHVDEECE